jgi:hypothetical protein
MKNTSAATGRDLVIQPSGTFSEKDYPANIKNQERMIQLAGSPDRVVPGHDALQFEKFPTQGRVAKIK